MYRPVCIVALLALLLAVWPVPAAAAGDSPRPGAFLAWPLANTDQTNITRLPDTGWTHHFLGVSRCGEYPAVVDATLWYDGKTYPGNRGLILPGVRPEQVRWMNNGHDGVWVNAFACYAGHAGVDISQPDGTHVLAAAAGYVANIQGSRYTLRHDDVNGSGQTWYTTYVHVTHMRYPLNAYVPQGEWIADVGSAHLHLEVQYNGILPEQVRNPYGRDEEPYDGCLWLDAGLCPRQAAFATPAAGQNLLRNGGFDGSTLDHWWRWGGLPYDFAAPGRLALGPLSAGAAQVLGQTLDYDLPAGSGFELSLQLANPSAQVKKPLVRLTSQTDKPVECRFELPPGSPPQVYRLHGHTSSEWYGLNLEIWPEPADGLSQLSVDDAALVYRPDIAPPANECLAPEQTGVDLDVGYISRTPRYAWDAVQKWPQAGEAVTFTAHVFNKGGKDSEPFAYQWWIDDVLVGSGEAPAVAAQSEVQPTLTWNWQPGRHVLRFVVDPDQRMPETSEVNNARADFSDALALSLAVEESVYRRLNARVNGAGTRSWEDWAQRAVGKLNALLAGENVRVRLDDVQIVPDASLPVAEDRRYDGQWGFSVQEYGACSAACADVPWPFVRDLTRRLFGWVDLTVFDVSAAELRELSAAPPAQPRHDLMDRPAPYVTLSAHSQYLLAQEYPPGARYHPVRSYSLDLPAETRLRLVDARGEPLAGIEVAVYPAQVTAAGRSFAASPAIRGRSDAWGQFSLGAQPFGDLAHAGPAAGVALVRLYDPLSAQTRDHWLELPDFNLAYWRGNRLLYLHTLSWDATPPPEGLLFLAAPREGQLQAFVLTPDGAHRQPLSATPGGLEAPALSADGARLAFIQPGSHALLWMDVNGDNLHALLPGDAAPAAPTWAPDGQSLAFARSSGGRQHLYRVRLDGSGLTPLTEGAADDTAPAFSPDGQRLFFWSSRSGHGWDLYALTLASGAVERLTRLEAVGVSGAPHPSPDGTQLVFACDVAGQGADVYLLAAGAAQPRNLTARAGYDGDPVWSPDGRQIVYLSQRDTRQMLYRFDLTRDQAGLLSPYPGVPLGWLR